MEKLFLGIKGNVLCLNKSNGETHWRTKLRSANITNVLYEKGFVFAYANGHFYCLNSNDGKIIWENGLAGMGYGACIVASENKSSGAITNEVTDQQMQASVYTNHGASSGGDGGDCGGGDCGGGGE